METPTASPGVCPRCTTEVAPRLLACPACGWLVHGETLKALARDAEAAEAGGQVMEALRGWRRVLELLPPGSRQLETVTARVDSLSRRLEEEGGEKPPEAERPVWLKGSGALVAVGLLLWKLKAVLGFVLTKGKALLLGLTKAGTLFSMLLSAGLYWTIWGFEFAVGLVLAIYVHEMGHVVALQRLGIRASAPMFIPGLGAMVRLKQYPASAREDARVGLAGPIWGLGAVVAFYGLHLVTGWASLAAIARFSAWINLFNLLPVWQLDGGRGFRALGRLERWAVVATMGVMWFLTEEGLLLLLGLAGVFRALAGPAPDESDRPAFLQFVFLVVTLALLTEIEVPGLE